MPVGFNSYNTMKKIMPRPQAHRLREKNLTAIADNCEVQRLRVNTDLPWPGLRQRVLGRVLVELNREIDYATFERCNNAEGQPPQGRILGPHGRGDGVLRRLLDDKHVPIPG